MIALGLIAKTSYAYGKVRVSVTAYCAGPCRTCGTNGRHTASGEFPKGKILAADWRVFPKNTRIRVPGWGEGRVKDKGGAIKGLKLDVLMPSHKEAYKWGRKSLTVTVLGKSKTRPKKKAKPVPFAILPAKETGYLSLLSFSRIPILYIRTD